MFQGLGFVFQKKRFRIDCLRFMVRISKKKYGLGFRVEFYGLGFEFRNSIIRKKIKKLLFFFLDFYLFKYLFIFIYKRDF